MQHTEKRPSSSNTTNTTTTLARQPENDDIVPDHTHPDVLLVDWDGPDDPENPKKYACYSFAFVSSWFLYLQLLLVGHLDENGLLL